ncbi:Peptidase family S49 [uncultured archaeon]|nr:Peptidase family S49 [uncultured archaeon]
MANNTLPARKPEGGNYLYWLIGGIALIALFFIFVMPSLPGTGCVGTVEISGEIITNDVPASILTDGVKGSATLASEIESADKRPDVKSVLVIIDSPGGSAVGSKEIYDALRSLNKSSVSYINELGASGGYYAAAGTDYIVANPESIVGSIGARATFSDLSGLFAKIGYNETVIKSGAMKDIGSQSRPMTDDEKMILEGIVNESFSMFRSDIESSRGSRLNPALFAQALDARIMTGSQAKKAGLVDELGNRKAALKKAAELGGITDEEPRECQLSSSDTGHGLLGSLSAQAIEFVQKSAGVPRLSYR